MHIDNIVIKYLIIFFVSFLPITEVRGGIPLAFYFFNSDPYKLSIGVVTAVAGNLLVAPFVIYLLKYVDSFIRNSRAVPTAIRRLYIKILDYAARKSRGFEKYEAVALAVFVAVPLPATGAWTASLIAFLLGMDKKKALASIEAGVLGASAIVFITIFLGITILKKLFAL